MTAPIGQPGLDSRGVLPQGLVLREVVEADLPIFFEHQLDSEASRLAAFPSRGWKAFIQHWRVHVLDKPSVRKQTIVCDGLVAGNILSWEQDEQRLVGYWIGRAYWGRGLASAALFAFAKLETRPLYAHVAAQNLASIRVLEKSGFRRASELRPGTGELDEYLYELE